MRVLLCLSVVALVAGSAAAQSPNQDKSNPLPDDVVQALLAAQSPNQDKSNPETDPAFDELLAKFKLPPETPQELWRDQIYDRQNDFRIRHLTQQEQAKILAQAKAKSENLKLSAIERRKWDDAYRETKWDIEYYSIDSNDIFTEDELLARQTLAKSLLEEAKKNLDADDKIIRKINYAVSQDERFAWQDRYDRAINLVHSLSTMTPQIIWLNNFRQAKTKEQKLSLLQIAWNRSIDPSVPNNEQKYWNYVWTVTYQQEAEKEARESSMPNPYDLFAPSVKAPTHTTCTKIGTLFDCDSN